MRNAPPGCALICGDDFQHRIAAADTEVQRKQARDTCKLRQGGHLEQHADPATLLTMPATPFVADFVGADRRVKALSVMPLDCSALEAGEARTSIPHTADLGQALVALLASDGRVEVRSGDRSLGVLTAAALIGQAQQRR